MCKINIIAVYGYLWYCVGMVDLNTQYEEMEANYKEIFIEAAEMIRSAIDKFKPEVSCKSCRIKCNIQKPDIFSDFPGGCPYYNWQMQALTYLTTTYAEKLKKAKEKINEGKAKCQCNMCGACCKLAVSEFSYTQLKQKAMRGDKFATMFTSCFIPYESEEEAQKAAPEYFELSNALLDPNERVYFYHCPKLTPDNKCSDYENRPLLCKDFPISPLKLLPSTCGYLPWRTGANKLAMSIKAREDIIAFYKQKLG